MLLTVACNPQAAPATPMPKSIPIQIDLPQGLRNGDAVRVEFTSRTTVENPVMILKITVVDHLTGQPVPSTVSIGDFVSPNFTHCQS